MATILDTREMALSDIASSSSLTETSPGIIPQLSKEMNLSERETTSSHSTILESAKLQRPHPLLYMPPLDTPPKQSRDLSDLYPGVHDLLRTIPFKMAKCSKQAPPLLLLPTTDDNVPYKPILAPPTLRSPVPLYLMAHSEHIGKPFQPPYNKASPTNLQAPFTTVQAPPTFNQALSSGMPHQLQEWVELVLPNIPVRPFVPKLCPTHHHDNRKKLPLLQINDEISHMKQQGFPLLWLPQEQASTIGNNKKFKKKKKEQKITFQNVFPSPSPPHLMSSDSSITTEQQSHLPINEDHTSLSLPCNKPLPSPSPPLSPSNSLLPPSSPNNKPLPSKSPSPLPSNRSFPSPPLSPGNKPLPPHQQLSLRRMEMKSLYVENNSPTNSPPTQSIHTTPTHSSPLPTHSSPPPTHSVAIQVNVNDDSTIAPHPVDDRLTDINQSKVTQIINSDIDDTNENEQVITLIEQPSPSPPPSPFTGQGSVMRQFLQLERQLALLEHTAQDMRDDFITSRRVSTYITCSIYMYNIFVCNCVHCTVY